MRAVLKRVSVISHAHSVAIARRQSQQTDGMKCVASNIMRTTVPEVQLGLMGFNSITQTRVFCILKQKFLWPV